MATVEWENKLRRGGYRITPQRQLVLESVERLGHGTPEEILAQVNKTATGVNLSTIYRNLEVLEEVGLVTHAHIGHGAPTYHSVDDHVHIHLVCDSCGDVQSIEASVAEPFLDELRTRTGFVTDVSHVALHGRCQRCSTASTHLQ
jgi:Fur family transcriptional regulator, ferric uptake regulator